MKKRGLLFLIAGLFALSACKTTSGSGISSLIGGGDNIPTATDDFGKDAVKLSFKGASSFEYLSTLNGKEVTINGYMATSSPVDGSFIFLMNMPYQSCPFCKPNTSQLSNTMEAYPKAKEKFSYTSSAIKIVGTLVVAEDVNKPFSDPFGYEFVFKIVDADYRILKDSDLPAELALWQKFANTTLISDLYDMFDYIDFVCKWPTYYVNNWEDENGVTQPGFYLYAADAWSFISKDGAQFNYGYKDGYFDGIISRIKKVSQTGFEELIKIINDAKELAEYALNELIEGHYTYQSQYVEMFDNVDDVYTLNDTTLATRADDVYYAFADWLSNFEM